MNTRKGVAIATILILLTVNLSFLAVADTNPRDVGSRTVIDNAEKLIVPEGDVYTIHGVKTYSKEIIINGTVNITAYDGSGSEGKLTLNAPRIIINGIVNGDGRGYGGGGGSGAQMLSTQASPGIGGTNGNGGSGGNGDDNAGGGGGGSPNGNPGSGVLMGANGYIGTVLKGGNGGDASWTVGGSGGPSYGGGGGGGAGDDNTMYGTGGGGGGGATGGASANGITSGKGGGPYGGRARTPSGTTTGWDGEDGGYSGYNTNDDYSSNFSVWLGSGGSGGSGGYYSTSNSYRYNNGGGGGGAGGGALILNATKWIRINGGLLCRGSGGGMGGYYTSSYNGGDGGGGAGGGILVSAPDIYISGDIDNRGRDEQSLVTGNGGTIKIFYHSLDYEKGSWSSHIDTGRYYKQYVNHRPVADLAVLENTSNINDPVEFTASTSEDPDGSLTGYNYFYGDGFSSGWVGSPTSTHSYKDSGDYDAYLLVKDEDGEVSEQSSLIRIHINYKPQADLLADPQEGEVHSIITFDASGSTDPDGTVIKYWYEFGDQNYSGWIDNPLAYHIYHEHQVYYAHCRVMDNGGEVSDWSDYIRVDVTEEDIEDPDPGGDNEPPTAIIEVDTSETFTSVPIKFDGSTSNDGDGTVEEYYFDFGDSTTSGWVTNSVIYHAFENGGSYTVSLKVRDDKSGISTNVAYVVITVDQNQPPTPVVLKEPIISGSTVKLEWTENTDGDFLRYEVHRSLYQMFKPGSDTLVRYIDDQKTTTYTIESLPYPDGHYFRVRVVDAGDMMADSNIVPTLKDDDDDDDGGVVISDYTTMSFTPSFKTKGKVYVSDVTVFTLHPPYGAPSPTMYYELTRGTEVEYSEPITIGHLSEGTHIIHYHSIYGNETEDDQRTDVVLDKTPPSLTLTSPTDGTMVSTTSIKVRWTATDSGSGLDKFDVRLDDQAWVDVGTSTTHTFNDLSEGSHTLKVRAQDNLNLVTEEQMTIMVDTAPPEVIVLQPVDGSTDLAKGKITVTWDGEDRDSGIKEYKVRLDSDDFKSVGNNTAYDFMNVQSGYHIITVRAVDQAGNKKDQTSVFVAGDTEKTTSTDAGVSSSMTAIILLLLLVILIVTVLMLPFMMKRAFSGKDREMDIEDEPVRKKRPPRSSEPYPDEEAAVVQAIPVAQPQHPPPPPPPPPPDHYQ